MQRRTFLSAAVAAGAAPAVAAPVAPAAPAADPLPRFDPAGEVVRGDMRFRRLGATGELVSCVGLGGHHIGQIKDEAESVRLIRAAVDAGVNFLDNCWDYHDGLSELRMGKALQDGYRRKAFLMTKIDGRTRELAARQIDQCLLRLRTDVIDLLQHHEVIRLEDADRIFAAGGAHEAVEAARKAGKVRFVGFTGHKDPLVHLRTLDVAAGRGVKFDAAQLPLNVLDAQFRSFARQVVPRLVRENVGVLGMKAFGGGAILKSNAVTAAECLRFALTLPAAVVITGIESADRLRQALDAAKGFTPMPENELAALLDRTRAAALSGKFEGFKTGAEFDATARHPDWLG